MQLALEVIDGNELNEFIDIMVNLVEEQEDLPRLHSVYFVHVLHTLTGQFVNGIDSSIVQVIIMPFLYANQYYTIDQLIAAYKKKMERNHARQDGTADKDKGYV
ncbi:hypothetical protein H7N50_002027 [Staphylococcus pseudintermedius]|nr:hypothetical protein [Staphylococcus pseudintermedius]